MKIIFFTENNHSGGLDSILVSLVNHWPHPADELVLVCNRSHPGLDVIARRVRRPLEIIGHKVPLHWQWKAHIDSWPVPRILKKVASVLIRYPFFWFWCRTAENLFRQLRSDRLLVVNGGYPAGDSCRAAAIAWVNIARDKPKCIFSFHNLVVRSRWWERGFEQLIDRLLVKSCQSFVAVSRACANSMTNRPAIAASGKVGYIYNGIAKPDAPSSTAIAAVRTEFGISEDTPLCLMLGTYEPRKGHDFLLEAFARVLQSRPTAKLVICGYGYEDDIQHVTSLVLAKRLVNSVFLEGFRDDVPTLINAADVMLVSSQAFESFGLTVVEAMARSTPVVATTIGGIPEVVGQDAGGFCFDADDIDGYAGQIIALLEDEKLRRKIGKLGYQRYLEMFTAERMAQEYAALLAAST